MKNAIGDRLLSAAEFVRQGAYLADVGTDHAYLPLLLLTEGKIRRAILTDINEGPLASARKNAEESGFLDKVSFKLTSGAKELSDLGITDYSICGMGGELIADIIKDAPHLKSQSVRLILQPMTKEGHLRRFLAKEGFSIIAEAYSSDAGKFYVCFAVEYTGEIRELDDFDAEFGDVRTRAEFSEAQVGYLNTKKRALERAVVGKERGGQNIDADKKMLEELMRVLNLAKRKDK